MRIKKQLVLLIIATLSIRLFFIILNPEKSITFQQDEYAYYAEGLLDGTLGSESFSSYSKRLMPGYPILMILLLPLSQSLVVSGFLISFLASIGSVIMLYKITKNILAAWIYAIFPPIWIQQSVRITTEPITAFIQLLGLFLYLRGKFVLSGVVIGAAFDIRIISFFLLLALCFVEFAKNRIKNIFSMLFGFSLPLFFLFIFNFIVFGRSELFQQFIHGERYGGVRFGLVQLINDILRTIDWGQYRILFSGSFYLLISFIALYSLYKNTKKSNIVNVMFYWACFSTLFVFSASPFTFIENYSRYSLPYYPAIIVGLVLILERLNIVKNLQNGF